MLRRKLSAGLLRPTIPTPQAASICPAPASPAAVRPRSRSLASAVLLSSQRNWKSETVVSLKSELKRRGLSQQGNKATLISRLESAETSALLGPLPPLPQSSSNTLGSTSSIPNGTRSISTSASLSQPPKSSKKGSSSSSTPSSANQTKEDPSVITTGPQISSQRTEAIKVDPIEPEQITVAPGLPQSDVAASTSGEKLDLRFPGSQAEKEVDQVIPLTPDNFSSGVATDSAPSLSAPKVLAVASASTHLEGGPVHGTHESYDAHELEKGGPSLKDLPGLGEALTSVLTSPARAWSNAGIRLPEINLPKSSGSKQEYKSEKRGLNDDERRGVWVLAGVLGLGLAFGGGGSSKAKHEKSLKEKAQEAVGGSGIPGAKVVKGDAKWEKASGAGIVGHGSRQN
ncbi:uncharacterized protein I303_105095 [Kwoniella dejecticola CBS 10117]|uniref:SAP domain-containing protein n=1 Tax=Kwoniella dejecticola CBS 10117 TaxID=1296121 RepID=A0A1A6A3G6_9TREE|nr:uncharacterized protein I303_05460 [Kwoniella dejecticola CBS 10117]OBR84601.1 hypothetical protein I303_05460 [Kwoniella dejecticola CBS 10117]